MQRSEAPAGATTRSARQPGNPVKRLQPDRQSRLLTLQEAAALLSVSVPSVRRLIGACQLPVVRFNRRLRVDTKDLDSFIERSKQRIV